MDALEFASKRSTCLYEFYNWILLNEQMLTSANAKFTVIGRRCRRSRCRCRPLFFCRQKINTMVHYFSVYPV